MDTWDTLVPVIVEYLKENYELNLKQLFLIIKDTLVYTEIGILAKVDGGLEELASLNSWLLCTTLQAVTNAPNDEEMIEATVELQIEMLSACLQKDLHLLRKLIDKLVRFAQELVEKLPVMEFPVDIPFDKENPLQSKPFRDANIQETVIKIKNLNVLYAILMCQVQVFTKICSYIGDMHPDVLSKVNDLYIKTFIFKKTPMYMRIGILNYFTRILKENINTTEAELDQIITILNFFGNALRYKVLWTPESNDRYDWNVLYFSIKMFLKEIVKVKQSQEQVYVKAVADGLIIWIKNGCQCLLDSKSTLWNIRQLILLAKKNLKKINDDSGGVLLDKRDLIKFLDYLEIIPELSSLYSLTITTELESKQEREVFPLLVKKLEEMSQKTTSIHAFDSLGPFELLLAFWKEIFCLIQSINDRFTSNTQINYMKSNDRLPIQTNLCFEELRNLQNIFTSIITSLVNQIVKAKLTLTSDFMAVVLLDFAYAGLDALSERNLVSEELKLHLFCLLVSPFCGFEKRLSSKLPLNVVQFYKSLDKGGKADQQHSITIMHKSFTLLFNLNLKSIKNPEVNFITKSILGHVLLQAVLGTIRQECIKLVPAIIVNTDIEINVVVENVVEMGFIIEKFQELLGILMDLVSLSQSDSLVIRSKTVTNLNEYVIIDPNGLVEVECKCQHEISIESAIFVMEKLQKRHGMVTFLQITDQEREILTKTIQKYIPIIKNCCANVECSPELQIQVLQILPQLIKNEIFMLEESMVESWIKILSSPHTKVMSFVPNYVKQVMNITKKRLRELGSDNKIITKEKLSSLFLVELIKGVNLAFVSQDKDYQENFLLLLKNFSATTDITESEKLDCFRFSLRFLLKSTSKVKYQAYDTVEIICQNLNVRPYQILNWYKMANIRFVMDIIATNYCKSNVKMLETVKDLPKLFGFATHVHFVTRYCKVLVACLLPLILKSKKCVDILNEIASVCDRDTRYLIKNAFSISYPFIHFKYAPELATKCIEYMQKTYGSNILSEIIFDSEKAVSDILIYYHTNASCVLEMFKFYPETSQSRSDPVSKLSTYLGNNMLGILKHFEYNINGDKFQQTETLLSLGQIIRLIGTQRITPYRFKIMTILNTALATNDAKMIEICIKIWHIFVHTVDMMELGPLLSAIIVSLKPYIDEYPQEIDEIFSYLIVENSNLMSKYFTDIFFLDELPIREELKRAIDSKQRYNSKKSFLEQLNEYLDHIRHKNVVVRAYGLKYLRNILRNYRTKLNNLIINEAIIHPILGGLLRNLMICCKENDENIQKYAAECLGELGALEPSHLAPDYQPLNSEFAFSIHTTEFAKLALDKLCHAYQVQSDVQNVDCFALAIQEVLVSNNVDPERGQKLEIWQAMPRKMRSLIEPLLKSHYTAIRKTVTVELHPIYGSIEAQTCEEWASMWATKIIETISNEETRNLLDAFMPSLKRDPQILSMIFPYVILHAILASNTKAKNEIVSEMTTVLEDILNTKDDNNMNIDSQDPTIKYTRSLISYDFFHSYKTFTQGRTEENMKLKCAKIVFGLFDFLERYLCELTTQYARAHTKEDFMKVKQFIEKFDYKMLAKVNYECEEYARALWYIEKYISYDSGSRLQRELGFLAKIHAELLDPDSVEGAMAIKEEEPTLEEQILTYNVTGRLHESAVCFERIMQLQKNDPIIMKEMVGCYLGLDQPETALLVSETFYSKFADDHPDLVLRANCAEPLWRLSRWDELETLIKEPGVKESDIWGINCGQLLIDFRSSKHEEFDREIDRFRLSLLRVLKTHESEQSIYQKCYSQILKLHMLTEIQKAEEIMRKIGTEVAETQVGRTLNNMLCDWEARNELLQPTSHIMEPLLCLRRIILNEMEQLLERKLVEQPRALKTVRETINESLGKLWVESTRLASNAKMFQQAALYIFNAEKYSPPELYIEKAKLLWEKGDQSNALKVLDTGINDTMQAIQGDIKNLSAPDLKLFGEARLLVAIYNSESAKFGPEMNLKSFKESIDTYGEQEKGFFLYAQYYERVHNNLDEHQKTKRSKAEYLVSAMIFYGKSLMFGCNYIYQSMPRLLTIWLDFTARKDDQATKGLMQQLNQYMVRYSESLPPFMFFTAFSQLTSRICHPNADVYTILKKILINLIKTYPQQSLWMFLGVSKSTYEVRARRCKEILHDKNLSSIHQFIWKFNRLTEEMISLSNADVKDSDFNKVKGGNGETTVTKLCPSFLEFFKTYKDVSILMPIQEQMSIVKPPTRDRDKPADPHNPFPNEPIYIEDVLDSVQVLSSLQKPKKITLVGSNGCHYDILMKPKDDLRRDFRLMEFNGVIKQLLYEDTDARQRRLHIRTYAVIPLNDECGLIEWVQNVTPYRSIVMKYYKQLGRGLSMSDLKRQYPQKRDSIEKKKQFFETVLLANHPLVFADWFRERFPNPHDWYQARCGYVKTLAVMSMVGYVLGLGDRHGENILMDGSCGDVVHVDFNCLFNRGEGFEFPEVVPFRLTHNMVKAMGPLGVDGLYRKCCELTMGAMQKQQNTLMSVLKPFVYDPLVSWTKQNKAQSLNQERTDPQAEEHLKQIEYRLQGYVKIEGRRTTAPLSTVGLVNHCITEATSVANLASMYIGWGPYY